MKRKVSDQIVEALQQAVERGVKQWLDENKEELLATAKQALIEAHRPAENPEPPVDDKLRSPWVRFPSPAPLIINHLRRYASKEANLEESFPGKIVE